MYLFKRDRSPYYWADVTVNGERHRFSTKKKTKADATHVVSAFVREAQNAAMTFDQDEMTLAEAMVRLLESERARKSGKAFGDAVNTTSRMLGRALSTDGEIEVLPSHAPEHEGRFHLDPDMMLHKLKTGDVEQLKDRRLGEGLSASTVNQEIGLLGRAWGAAGDDWNVKVRPRVKFKRLKTKHKLRFLSLEEERALIVALDPNREIKGVAPPESRSNKTRRQLQDQYDLVVFLLDTGARWGEVAELDWSSVDTHYWKSIRIYRWKTESEGVLTMTHRLRAVLERRWEEKGRSPYIFPNGADPHRPRPYSPKGIMKALVRAGINTPSNIQRLGKATPHTLRHTFASRLVQQGVSLYTVQKLLGHTTPAMTQRYAFLADDTAASLAAGVLDDIHGKEDTDAFKKRPDGAGREVPAIPEASGQAEEG